MYEKLKNNFLLILILILAIALRINYDTFCHDMVFDELAIISVAKQTFPFGILKALSNNDYHAPLYYFIIHPLTYFNNEVTPIRLLNTIFSLFNIFVFYKIGTLLKDKKTGYILALFLAVSHIQISLVNFSKFYTFCFLIVSIIFYYFIDFIKNKRSGVALAIANSIFILSYTFGFIFVLIEYLILGKKALKKALLAPLGAFLLYLPILISQTKISFENILSPHANYPSVSLFSIYAVLNDYFSPLINYATTSDSIQSNTLLIEAIKSQSIYLFFIFIALSFIPILISSILIIRNFKNEYISKIAILGISYFLWLIILAKIELTGVIPTYYFPSGLILLVILGCSIGGIENKKIRYLIFSYLVIIQLIIPNCFDIKKRDVDKIKIYSAPIEFIKAQDKNSAIITTVGGRFLKLYFKDRNIYDFDYEAMSGSFKRDYPKLIFNSDIKHSNKKNILSTVKDEILKNRRNPAFEKYVYDRLIKDNDRLILVFYSDDASFIAPDKDLIATLNRDDYNYHLENSSLIYQLKTDDNEFNTIRMEDIIQSYSNKYLIEIIEKYYKRKNIKQYRYNGEKWYLAFDTNDFSNSTLWIAQNALFGWFFIEYQKY